MAHPSSIIQATKRLMEDLNQTIQSERKGPTVTTKPTRWEAPPQGKLKLNWDAGLDKINNKVGIGVIIRDWEGTVRASLRMNHNMFLDPLLAKAYAVFQASTFLKTLGWQNVILEGDSLQVFNSLKSSEVTNSYVGILLRDTKSILDSFTNWSIKHVRRACNSLAHALCQDTLSISDSTVSFDTIPFCIQTLI
ncbi:uncharacterized protein LOC122298789 [Carya illinoinensis]|uniref:uncharacterized protein LOC122298789 n=1 Tax=Carya illinoinensis TaxID=32201 RepID=UPI001C7225B0|nr:uncharacterized protein LOC122298789 [Carya illinoinensis]